MAVEIDKAFAARVAAFCIGTRVKHDGPDPVSLFGKAFANWDGNAKITNKYGRPLGVFREKNDTFSTHSAESRHLRIARALTEIADPG